MPLEIEFSEERNVVVMRLIGQTTAEELTKNYESLFSKEKFSSNIHALWDVSGINLIQVPVSEFRRLPLLLSNLMPQRGTEFKAALVTNRTADYQLLKIYLSLLRLVGSARIRLFRSIDDANAWIDEETLH